MNGKPLRVAVRVVHPTRGGGIVDEIRMNDRDKPYKVRFDNGEVHYYSQDSLTKLAVGNVAVAQGSVPAKSPRTSLEPTHLLTQSQVVSPQPTQHAMAQALAQPVVQQAMSPQSLQAATNHPTE